MKEYLIPGLTILLIVGVLMMKKEQIILLHNTSPQNEKQPAESGVEMDKKNSGASTAGIVGASVLGAAAAGYGLYKVYKRHGNDRMTFLNENPGVEYIELSEEISQREKEELGEVLAGKKDF